MGKLNFTQNNFNGGELSPRLLSRSDFDKFKSGCSILENYIPTTQGNAIKRAGTKFAAEVKSSNLYTFLIPFTDTNGTDYIIEVGHQYFRFFKADGTIVGAPFEIATPYIDNAIRQLSYVQSGDVLYMTTGSYWPRKLSKNSSSDTDWSISEIEFAWPPFKDENIDSAKGFYISASTGTGVTLTAVGHTPFNASMPSNNIYVKFRSSIADYTEWAASTAKGSGDKVRYGDNVYVWVSGSTTGDLAPVHTNGTLSDGGVKWKYLHSGEGYVKISAYVSDTLATVDVIVPVPDDIVGIGNETEFWAFSSWGDLGGFGVPNTVTIHEDRLIWGGTSSEPQTIWASVTGDYQNFKYGVTNSDAYKYQLGSQDLNTILWMNSARTLLIGTDNGEFTVSGSRIYEAITPTNVRVVRHTNFGSLSQTAQQVGDTVLFVQKDTRKVRELKYDYQSDSYVGVDRTILSEHITKPAVRLSARQQSPYSIVWYPRFDHINSYSESDGVLLGFTYDTIEDVYGWHRHTIGGNGIVESAAILKKNTYDQLWLVVRRTINGSSVRYVEYMDLPLETDEDVEDAHYVDCGIIYDGAATTTITGLAHLEGETVTVLADGATHPDKTVSSGQITLDRSSSKVHVGYGYTANLQIMPIAEGGDFGSAHGQLSRITTVTLRLLNTGSGLWVGKDSSDLQELHFRTPDMLMDEPVPLFSGLKGPTSFPSGPERDLRIHIQHRLPLPCTLLGLIADLVVYDK